MSLSRISSPPCYGVAYALEINPRFQRVKEGPFNFEHIEV